MRNFLSGFSNYFRKILGRIRGKSAKSENSTGLPAAESEPDDVESEKDASVEALSGEVRKRSDTGRTNWRDLPQDVSSRAREAGLANARKVAADLYDVMMPKSLEKVVSREYTYDHDGPLITLAFPADYLVRSVARVAEYLDDERQSDFVKKLRAVEPGAKAETLDMLAPYLGGFSDKNQSELIKYATELLGSREFSEEWQKSSAAWLECSAGRNAAGMIATAELHGLLTKEQSSKVASKAERDPHVLCDLAFQSRRSWKYRPPMADHIDRAIATLGNDLEVAFKRREAADDIISFEYDGYLTREHQSRIAAMMDSGRTNAPNSEKGGGAWSWDWWVRRSRLSPADC